MDALDRDTQQRYLDRLGVDPAPPSIDGLRELHRRHAERVPYETLWIHGAEGWDIDPAPAAHRIAMGGRGGYCYHLNGALALPLRSLGYMVTRHAGGVHGPDGPDPARHGNHLVLTVDGLPSDDNPGGQWYVDVGLGDALHEPVALVAGEVEQGPFRFVLDAHDGGWHLAHDPAGSFTGMAWTMDAAGADLLERQHHTLSTSPDSGFVRTATAQRRDARGVDILRGLVLTRVGSDATTRDPITDRGEWFGMLHDVFGLTFHASARGTADRLWERTLSTHRAWEASTT